MDGEEEEGKEENGEEEDDDDEEEERQCKEFPSTVKAYARILKHWFPTPCQQG